MNEQAEWWRSISTSTSTVLLERTIEILRFYKKCWFYKKIENWAENDGDLGLNQRTFSKSQKSEGPPFRISQILVFLHSVVASGLRLDPCSVPGINIETYVHGDVYLHIVDNVIISKT